MQHDSVQLRSAVQMFIDLLLEHREQLEPHIEERHRVEARQILAQIRAKQTKTALESASDTTVT